MGYIWKNYPVVDIQKTMDKHLLIGKSTISTGPFSIAMLLYQRVSLNPKPSPTLRFMTVGISLAMGCKMTPNWCIPNVRPFFQIEEIFQWESGVFPIDLKPIQSGKWRSGFKTLALCCSP